jgi:hypothetical protein
VWTAAISVPLRGALIDLWLVEEPVEDQSVSPHPSDKGAAASGIGADSVPVATTAPSMYCLKSEPERVTLRGTTAKGVGLHAAYTAA